MADATEVRRLVLLALRLRSLAGAEVVADDTSLSLDVVDGAIESLAADGFVLRREGRKAGWALTPLGRAEGERLLATELDAAGAREVVMSAYRAFLALNAPFLELCTDWQLRTVDGRQVPNDHNDGDHDAAVIARLETAHDAVCGLADQLSAALPRMAAYRKRFTSAIERVRAGDGDWFTRPMIDSYHTVWFELHEDLLATLGIERGSEERVAG